MRAMVDEVLVVDAGSTDRSAERAAERERVRVISAPGTTIQARLNLGLEQARNEYVLLLNSDAFVDPQTPERLAEILEQRPQVGASGASLRFEDGSPQDSGDRYKTLLRHIVAAVPGGRRLPGSRSPCPEVSGGRDGHVAAAVLRGHPSLSLARDRRLGRAVHVLL